MTGAATKTRPAPGVAPGSASLALGMIRNPGLRSYVCEQLVTARSKADRDAALLILMENIGWSEPGSARGRHGPN